MTRLWASVGVTHSYSSRPFLRTLVLHRHTLTNTHTCPCTHRHMYVHMLFHTLTTYTLTTHILASQSRNCRATPPRCLPQSLLPSNGDELDLCPPCVVDLICWQQWGIPHILLHRHCDSLRTTPGLNLGQKLVISNMQKIATVNKGP